MTAETILEADPAPPGSDPPQAARHCRSCFSEVHRNTRLRVSFCPVHGLGFVLVPRPPTQVRAPTGSRDASGIYWEG
ncbi:MAG: hypothetical protein ACREDK_06145 [Thermoplasmata archaeon]